MTLRTLIRRSLRFHARSHFGVVLGAAIGSAALIGALVVGDSVRGSLRERALERVGRAHYLLESRDRTFSDSVITWQDNSATFGLHLVAIASGREGTARANTVNLYGVRPDFWSLSPTRNDISIEQGHALINQELASRLGVSSGDVVMLRFHSGSALSAEAPLSPKAANSLVLRLKVQKVLSPNEFGDFSPRAVSAPPFNAFVRLEELQHAAGLNGSANFLLQRRFMEETDGPFFKFRSWLFSQIVKLGISPPEKILRGQARDASPEILTSKISRNWNLVDAGLMLTQLERQHAVEVKSKRVFLDPPVVRSIINTNFQFWVGPAGNEQLVLTYLANLIKVGTNLTPYSMITAAGPPYTPAGMKDGEIILNQWLADDLKAAPGDEVSLVYFDPESGARLVERTNWFRVHSVVPLEMPWADRTLMPDFPGIEKAESTSDWDAGFPLVNKIRAKDEDYWRKYRGTPKAFVALAAGQKMWRNRFGDVTSIRFPIPSGTEPEVFRQALERSLLLVLKPEELGLRFEPVREQALKAAEDSQDFGQLFLGFSIFLVVAALLLMALLFQFGLEQRATEVGTLLALGFTVKQVRRLLLLEGAALALLGGIIGAVGGIGYAKAMLWGLATVWRSAVGSFALGFHATAGTLIFGTCASTVVAVFTIWVTLRKQAKRPARELLEGGSSGSIASQTSKAAEHCRTPKPGGVSVVHEKRGASWSAAVLCRFGWGWVAAVSGLSAVAIIILALSKGGSADAGAFFWAGSLLLVAGLALAAVWLRILASGAGRLTLAGLGARGCARRGKRSLATMALLASGCFVIVAIGVFRLDANQEAIKRSSGTGGFALIGEAAMPVVQDLNSEAGREFFGLGDKDLEGVQFVPFRVREGDEASCLNLNRAQKPRVLGVKPELLASRDAFTFQKALRDIKPRNPWLLLSPIIHNEVGVVGSIQTPSIIDTSIPAIGDANSIEWAMGKKIGDTIDYTDEQGRAFKLRLVGAVANSILQGSLIIDEAEFLKRFPSESGYRMFLIDTPSNSVSQISATLSRALQDVGLEVTPAAQRLNAFNAVQNTYLGTFQVLGGLGLLLGSAGLGVVVLRNVLERRSELGLMMAMGFRRRELQKLLLSEHGALLGIGLGIGIFSAAVAVLPALLSPGRHLPYLSLALTLGAVLFNGVLWTWLATRYALRGDLMAALRND